MLACTSYDRLKNKLISEQALSSDIMLIYHAVCTSVQTTLHFN